MYMDQPASAFDLSPEQHGLIASLNRKSRFRPSEPLPAVAGNRRKFFGREQMT
jgi:hypothetical protein